MSHHSVKPNPNQRVPKGITPLNPLAAPFQPSQRQPIVNATEANEPLYENARTTLAEGTSEVRTNTKDVSKVQEHATKSGVPPWILMVEIAEEIPNEILMDLIKAGHTRLHKIKSLNLRLECERHRVVPPPGFKEDLLSSQSLAFIAANITLLPVHHAFVSALLTHKATIDVWELACTITGGRNTFAHPECSMDQFEAVGTVYADCHNLDLAKREVLGKLCRAARDIVGRMQLGSDFASFMGKENPGK